VVVKVHSKELAMPTRMRKLPNQRKYRVYDGHKVTANATSKRNALRQVRLLKFIGHKNHSA